MEGARPGAATSMPAVAAAAAAVAAGGAGSGSSLLRRQAELMWSLRGFADDLIASGYNQVCVKEHKENITRRAVYAMQI